MVKTFRYLSVALLLLTRVLCFNLFSNTPDTYKDNLQKLLFPSRDEVARRLSLNVTSRPEPSQHMRSLQIGDPPPGTDDALCVICRGLDKCDVLNGLLIQEVYYPEQNAQFGTCKIYETLGVRMDSEIFGNGRTFRDTPQCRDIVMQYLCLFWGSQNAMYKNLCYWKEDVTDPDPQLHQIAPRPPCRSFCVQIAEVCANEYEFLGICENIACPPTQDECTPDPVVGGEVVAAGVGCDIPFLRNPYGAASRTSINIMTTLIAAMLVNVGLLLLL